jgi:hypothetical protein
MVANHHEECFSFSKNERYYDCRALKHENSTNETKNRKRARLQHITNLKMNPPH